MSPERVNQILDYLDSLLDGQEVSELSRWISESPDHADAFFRVCIVQKALEKHFESARHYDFYLQAGLLNQDADGSYDERVEADLHDFLDAMQDLGRGSEDVTLVSIERGIDQDDKSDPQTLINRSRQFWAQKRENFMRANRVIVIPVSLVAAACIAALVSVVALIFYLNTGQGPSIAETPMATPPTATSPSATPPSPSPFVATLHSTYDASFTEHGTGEVLNLVPGARLRPGVLELQTGAIELILDRGAKVLVQAPAVVELIDDNAIRLDSGQAVARVPESAVGFTAKTQAAAFVDLGTEFGLRVLANGEVEASVFEGSIAASAYSDGGEVGLAQIVLENQAVAISKRGEVVHIPDGTTLAGRPFPRTLSLVRQNIQFSGAVRYLYEPPPSLSIGQFTHPTHASLMLERDSLVLSNDLAVDWIPGPGERLSTPDWQDAGLKLPAGSVVDAYLLHIDRDALIGDVARYRGDITFAAPIVGLIFDDQSLNLSDPICGNPETQFPQAPGRGMARESRVDPDTLQLSPDRRTLTFDIAVVHMDQLRILVHASGRHLP